MAFVAYLTSVWTDRRVRLMFHSLSVEHLRYQLHGAAAQSFMSLASPKMKNDTIDEIGDGTYARKLSLTFDLALTA
jgi:hypothetical protein